MTPFLQLEERYKNDPGFRQLVDSMRYIAEDLQMSPGELRQAAVFAEWKIQLMKPPGPITMSVSDARKRGILITDD